VLIHVLVMVHTDLVGIDILPHQKDVLPQTLVGALTDSLTTAKQFTITQHTFCNSNGNIPFDSGVSSDWQYEWVSLSSRCYSHLT